MNFGIDAEVAAAEAPPARSPTPETVPAASPSPTTPAAASPAAAAGGFGIDAEVAAVAIWLGLRARDGDLGDAVADLKQLSELTLLEQFQLARQSDRAAALPAALLGPPLNPGFIWLY